LGEIVAHLKEEAGVDADVTGSVVLQQRKDKAPMGIMDLHIALAAPSLSSFRNLFAAKTLPSLGPVSYATRLTGTTETLSLENVLIRAGHPGPVRLEFSGRADKVVFDSNQPLQGADIVGSFFAEKTSLLSPHLGVQIPDLGPMESTWRLVERKGGYGVEVDKWVIGDQEKGWLRAKGRVEYLIRGTDVAFGGIDFYYKLQELDSRTILSFLGMDRTDLGKINGNFSVSGSMQDLALSNMDLSTVYPEKLKISIHGGVRHIRPERERPLEGINLELSATAPDMNALRALSGLAIPELGPLSMRVNMNDREGILGIETFRIRTGPKEKSTVLIEGRMPDILNTEQMNFTTAFEAATRPWMEKFYGHSVPQDHRMKGKATFTGSRDHYVIEGSAHSGKTHLTVEIARSLVNGRPQYVGNVSAPKIYLDDLGIYPEDKDRGGSAQKEKSGPGGTIFSDEPYRLEGLKSADVFFSLDTQEVIGKGFEIKDMDLGVSLDAGLLRIGPAKWTYADGFVSLEAAVDTRGSDPEMQVKLTAEDLEVGALLSHVHSPLLLGGHLNTVVNLQSRGNSPRQIAASLNGEIGIAIENGQIKKLADLMGADAIDLVATTAKQRDYQKLNCLALRFSFEDGLGNSQVVYVDTPSVRSRGRGTLDLREEKIDLVIQPKPKKGQLGGSSAVRIKGRLDGPKASKLPFKEAARLYGEIFMPYAFLPARALGYLWYLMKKDKDESSPCLTGEFKGDPQ
jgi:hypothetical protein